MMYVHFCKNCSRFYMLNGHKMTCPACDNPLSEMRMPYMDYVNMSAEEREELAKQCHDEDTLKNLSTTYRMYKYSKWYRQKIANPSESVSILPNTGTLCDRLIGL